MSKNVDLFTSLSDLMRDKPKASFAVFCITMEDDNVDRIDAFRTGDCNDFDPMLYEALCNDVKALCREYSIAYEKAKKQFEAEKKMAKIIQFSAKA